MKYTTIIFDLDGTLLNTLADLAAATNYALAEHKLPQRTTDEVRLFVGNGIHKLIERAVPANTPAELQEEVFASFNRYYKQHCADSTRPYEGVPQLLQQLRAAGCRTAIVSNKADYGVQALAKQYFDDQLDAACGERAGIAKSLRRICCWQLCGNYTLSPQALSISVIRIPTSTPPAMQELPASAPAGASEAVPF